MILQYAAPTVRRRRVKASTRGYALRLHLAALEEQHVLNRDALGSVEPSCFGHSPASILYAAQSKFYQQMCFIITAIWSATLAITCLTSAMPRLAARGLCACHTHPSAAKNVCMQVRLEAARDGNEGPHLMDSPPSCSDRRAFRLTTSSRVRVKLAEI